MRLSSIQENEEGEDERVGVDVDRMQGRFEKLEYKRSNEHSRLAEGVYCMRK